MKNSKLKILVLTGIRSEYDILYPVMSELSDKGHDVSVVVSGAHLSDAHNNTWNRIESDGFKIADKIDTLLSTDRVVQRSKGVGLLIQGLTQTTERLNPDFILILGDREESIASAIVGNYMNKLVVHLGGGDPVFNNADDPVRFAVSKLAHIHCCFAKAYARNLVNVGEEDFRVFFTGNPVYANIDNVPKISRDELNKSTGLRKEKYLVLLNHPLSSEVADSYKQMKIILKSLESFCQTKDYQVVCVPPNSDPGSFGILKAIREYQEKDWFIKLETLPRVEFVNLMRNTMALLGNSSMGFLEAPHYKLPVINIGARQMGRLNAGNVEFVTHEIRPIIQAIEKATMDKEYRDKISKLENPYGDSTAPKNIRKAIESVNLNDVKWYVKQKLC